METKKCPYCAEEILIDARKCKYCGEFLDDTLRREKSEDHKPKEVIVKQKHSGLVIFLIVLAIIALLVLLIGV